MKGDGSSPHQRRDSVSKRLGNSPRSQAPKCLMQDVNSRLSEFFPLAILTPKSWCRVMNIISHFTGQMSKLTKQVELNSDLPLTASGVRGGGRAGTGGAWAGPDLGKLGGVGWSH